MLISVPEQVAHCIMLICARACGPSIVLFILFTGACVAHCIMSNIVLHVAHYIRCIAVLGHVPHCTRRIAVLGHVAHCIMCIAVLGHVTL